MLEPVEITPEIEKRWMATMAKFSLDNSVHPGDLLDLMMKSIVGLAQAIDTVRPEDFPETQVDSLLNESALRAYIKEGLSE